MTKVKKPFVFVSDFDGTLTDKDFYLLIMDDYLGDKGKELYDAWKRKEYKDIDFLGLIFKSINRNEDEIMEDILRIPFDKYAADFIQNVKDAGGDFVILSAGTSYYIHRVLQAKGICDVTVYSNEGYYNEKGIHLKKDSSSPYYSEMYGIDKALVVSDLKEKYEKLYYAGDSAPDVKAAMLSNVAFAKGRLQAMLHSEGHPFIPIKSFKDITDYFKCNKLL